MPSSPSGRTRSAAGPRPSRSTRWRRPDEGEGDARRAQTRPPRHTLPDSETTPSRNRSSRPRGRCHSDGRCCWRPGSARGQWDIRAHRCRNAASLQAPEEAEDNHRQHCKYRNEVDGSRRIAGDVADKAGKDWTEGKARVEHGVEDAHSGTSDVWTQHLACQGDNRPRCKAGHATSASRRGSESAQGITSVNPRPQINTHVATKSVGLPSRSEIMPPSGPAMIPLHSPTPTTEAAGAGAMPVLCRKRGTKLTEMM